jgi:ubiquitin-activating enzyme E1
VWAFQEEQGRLPTVNDAADASKVVALALAFEKEHAVLGGTGLAVDESVVIRVSMHAGVQLQPMCAFWGGVVAQELVKVAGKYTPIQQFLNHHAFSCLPETPPAAADAAPLCCRYDDMIAVFGRKFQEKLGDLRIFMVGCGALGCEFMKNFALLGVCCGPTGSLSVTDNDRIEVSNLNRQFLFREENVGKAKSECAAARATTMNGAIRVHARHDLVAPETEHLFDEAFWNGPPKQDRHSLSQ